MSRKRQAEGIAKAKAIGVYAQQKRTVNPDKIKQLFDGVWFSHLMDSPLIVFNAWEARNIAAHVFVGKNS